MDNTNRIDENNGLSPRRRNFLRTAGGAVILASASLTNQATAQSNQSGLFSNNPFSLGVASGDPLPDSVVLWTRLAPKPTEKGGGMPDRQMPVQWQVATDEGMRDTVRRGNTKAFPEYAHSVHVDVQGLDANTEYYYQFKVGPYYSSIARTKTAPAEGTSVDEFNFAFASCQAWYEGFYSAYKYMAEDNLDLIIHLGDYIYEYGIGPDGGERDISVPQPYRNEPVTLDRYRLQYGLYKSDPDLQAAHGSCPWIVTLDDHEVDNNWADEVPQDPDKQSREAFLARRANALRAYYEHMPIRPSRMPDGPDMPLYRNFTFGDLLEINVLDTRQYRSNQACGDGLEDDCEERFDHSRTMLGNEQEEWLLNNLGKSTATWDVLAQQVMMAQLDHDPGPDGAFGMDLWDGYVAARERLFSGFAEQNVQNPVVLTGDVHRHFAANLKADFENPDSATIGTEFVGTSISSGGDGTAMDELGRKFIKANNHIKYHNAQRGYVRCEVRPEQWRADYRVLDYVTRQGSPIRTDVTFLTEDGNPGLQG